MLFHAEENSSKCLADPGLLMITLFIEMIRGGKHSWFHFIDRIS